MNHHGQGNRIPLYWQHNMYQILNTYISNSECLTYIIQPLKKQFFDIRYSTIKEAILLISAFIRSSTSTVLPGKALERERPKFICFSTKCSRISNMPLIYPEEQIKASSSISFNCFRRHFLI